MMWLGAAVEHQDTDPGVDAGTKPGLTMFASLEVPTAIQSAPTPTLDSVVSIVREILSLDSVKKKVLITMISARPVLGTVFAPSVPYIGHTSNVPPHHAAVHVHALCTIEILEVP